LQGTVAFDFKFRYGASVETSLHVFCYSIFLKKTWNKLLDYLLDSNFFNLDLIIWFELNLSEPLSLICWSKKEKWKNEEDNLFDGNAKYLCWLWYHKE